MIWTARYTAHQDGQGGDCRWDIITEDGDQEHHIATLPGWTAEDATHAQLIKEAPALLKALTRIANHETRSDRRHRNMAGTEVIDDLQRTARQAIEAATHGS